MKLLTDFKYGKPAALLAGTAALLMFAGGFGGQKHEAKPQINSNDSYGNAQRASMVGSGIAAMVAMAFKGKMPANLRRSVLIGATFGVGTLIQMARGDDPSTAIFANTISAAAGYVAFGGFRKLGDIGLRVFREDLERTGQKAMLSGIEEALKNAKAKFPLLEGILDSETFGSAGALMTIPIAHSITARVLAAQKRRETNHGDLGIVPSIADNQAGRFGGRIDPSPRIVPSFLNANVNLTGTLSSYYNTSQALEDL